MSISPVNLPATSTLPPIVPEFLTPPVTWLPLARVRSCAIVPWLEIPPSTLPVLATEIFLTLPALALVIPPLRFPATFISLRIFPALLIPPATFAPLWISRLSLRVPVFLIAPVTIAPSATVSVPLMIPPELLKSPVNLPATLVKSMLQVN